MDNATVYIVTVEALNLAGNGESSEAASDATFAPPSAPTVEIITGDGWINTTWSVPASDAPVLGYILYRSTGSGDLTKLVELGPVTSYNDTGVINGQEYTYRVVAFSGAGIGAASAISSVIPSTTADAPIDLTAARGNGNVTLSWTAPGDDGGAEITGYAVFIGMASGDEAYIATVNGLTYVIDELTNGQTYYFKVAAVNLNGNGVPSEEASATPATTPDAPSNLVATANADNVTLTWNAPANDGGSAITGYQVHRLAGTTEIVVTVTATSYIDKDVARGISYSYWIVAVNAIGAGAASEHMINVAPGTIPSAPTMLAAEEGVGLVNLTWSDPANSGGFAVTAYNVYRGLNGGAMTKIATVTALSYTDKSGVQGTTYVYRVTAINAKGESQAISVTAMALYPPAAPTGLTVEKTEGKIVLTWIAPSTNATSAAVTGYAIYRGSTSGEEVLIAIIDGSDVTTFTDENATDGAVYYRVAALTTSGQVDFGSMSPEIELAERNADADVGLALVTFGVITMICLFFILVARGKKEQI